MYSKNKVRARTERLTKIKKCQVECDINPTSKNLSDLEILHGKYDGKYEFIAHGIIVRSRANWYEYCEKSSKYFLSLENCRKKKEALWDHNMENDEYMSDPEEILKEIQAFYTNLYDLKINFNDEGSIETFLNKVNINMLTDEHRISINNKLTVGEWYATGSRLSFTLHFGLSLENV